MRIIICGDEYLRCLTIGETAKRNGAEVVYIDDFLGQGQYAAGIRFSEVRNTEYDYLVLVFKEKQAVEIARVFWIEAEHIPEKKIINFYEVYHSTIPKTNIERMLSVGEEKEYEGCILGISHAQSAIQTRYMKKPFLNLAYQHQDIYYNKKSLEYVIEHHYDRVKSLKYIVFDMFDYSYFNYDTSLSENAAHYYLTSGFYQDEHNFSRNKNYNCTIQELVRKLENTKPNAMDSAFTEDWNRYFKDIHKELQYEGFLDADPIIRQKLMTDSELENFGYGSIVFQVFNATINENVNTFKELLGLIYLLNPEMKVYLILLPRYVAIEKMEEQSPFFKAHKKMFFNILNIVQKQYPFTFLDFKEEGYFKEIRSYYYDPAHFNCYGAKVFTEYLESILEE